MKSTFLAWITRMPLIKRWSLMHCSREENISEHSHQVAVVAHLLCVISNEYYDSDLSPEKAATMAIFHEISETKLQDLNSKTKYQTPEFTKQFKILENLAEIECVNTLPEELKKYYRNYIIQNETDPTYHTIVKAADIICAYIKTKEELRYHNAEFEEVHQTFEHKLQDLSEKIPAVKYFLEHFMDMCWCSLDKLSGFDVNK